MSEKEGTRWRDVALSERHRLYGTNTPGVDIDHLLIEYDKGKAIGLVDHKRYKVQLFDFDRHPSFCAMRDLAAHRPAFVAYYWPDIWAWKVHCLNEPAREYFEDGAIITEEKYVEALYAMRGRCMPGSRRRDLSTKLPTDADKRLMHTTKIDT